MTHSSVALNLRIAQPTSSVAVEDAMLPEIPSHSLPGTLLSIGAVSPDRKVHEISVEILPAQHEGHVVNFADSHGEGWLDSNINQLRLQFHLFTVFNNAKVDELWLSVPGKDNKIVLSPTCVVSPIIGQGYPKLSWSAQSRFVVDETIALPDWTNSFAKLELFAGVAGKPEKVGTVYVSKAIRISGENNSSSKHSYLDVPPPTPELVSASVQDSMLGKYKNFLLVAHGAVDLKGMNRLLLIAVVIPTLVSIIYFGLIASDTYISESRFVVRSPQHQVSTGLGALFQGAGFSRSQDDTYTVHDYIFSRDALKQLDAELALSKEYSDSRLDVVSRFAGLDWDHSFEALYRYYQKLVTLDLDTSSSILTLSVRAFSPETAYQINEKLLGMSEALVNQLNERGRQDMIRFASAEVASAEQKAKSAALAVTNFRNLKGVFDPDKQSALQLQQVSKLQDELIANKIQLSQIRTLARDNPQIPSLQKRIETLQSEINSETAKVAGGDRSLANKSTEYEGLILERGFAEKQLAAALTSLEQARNDAQRKQLYLERIVEPGRPDIAVEPRRIRNIFATLVLGLIAWGILTILLAGIREHQD